MTFPSPAVIAWLGVVIVLVQVVGVIVAAAAPLIAQHERRPIYTMAAVLLGGPLVALVAFIGCMRVVWWIA